MDESTSLSVSIIDIDNNEPQTSRFSRATSLEVSEIKESRIPENTQKKQNWAIKVFREWWNHWKVLPDGDLKVLKDMVEWTSKDLNYVLQFFIVGVRDQNSKKYPPRTLKELIAMVQHYFNNKLGRSWSIFLDKEFLETRKTLDGQMRKTAAEGGVSSKRKAGCITVEQEKSLWEKGILGDSDGKQLVESLLFSIGLHCALRACKEHRDLTFGENSQLMLSFDEQGRECLIYKENVSKCKNFGIKQSRIEPKIVTIYSAFDERKDVIRLYKKYISHRPESNGRKGCLAFYLTPLQTPIGNCWYKCVPMGVHSIEKVTKSIMQTAGYDGFYTNTSLRRSAKTRLVKCETPKELARKITGHVSDADNAYVATDSKCDEVLSSIIYGERQVWAERAIIMPENLHSSDDAVTQEDKPIQIKIRRGDREVLIEL